jgi:wyosine [tRNA(Phe)-imidazoG37] synthetase (radical SAM superfamily)
LLGQIIYFSNVKNSPAVKMRSPAGGPRAAATRTGLTDEAAFGYPRDFLDNQLVYVVLSPRARGLAVGVNVNPLGACNLRCAYCEVRQPGHTPGAEFDVDRMLMELGQTLELAQGGWLHQWPRYAKLPPDLLQVRHVALSGDGEPTLAPHFLEATRAVVQLRHQGRPFKIVLVTNSTGLDRSQARAGIALLQPTDEVWVKLEAGTQEYMNRISGSSVSLNQIVDNILLVAHERPVVVQSLFPAIDGEEPPTAEIRAYAQRLKELKDAGGQISLVQIYSATRPMANLGCSHLPLRALSEIAQTVRRVAGLRAEVF